MTDPGYFSIHHLHFTAPSCHVALPLSAARGLWNLHRTPSSARLAGAFLLSQPEFFEQALLAAAEIHAPIVAPHGTVAATALDLALVSSRGPVIFAGLDLCTEDMLSHARPNAFDLLSHCRSTLLSPHHSQSFHRAVSQNPQPLSGDGATRPGERARFFASPSLRTYAGWFAGSSHTDSARIFRLFPSPVALPRMRALYTDSLRSLARTSTRASNGPTLKVNDAYPPLEKRRAIAERLLDEWHRALLNGRAAGESTSSLSFHRSPTLHSLLYYLEPRLLLEAKRKLRRGEVAEARAAVVRACEGGAAFLRMFAAKVFRDI
jgi:hypothetical protein